MVNLPQLGVVEVVNGQQGLLREDNWVPNKGADQVDLLVAGGVHSKVLVRDAAIHLVLETFGVST